MPIHMIEVDTNKGKVIVHFNDPKKEAKEYKMDDILDNRNFILSRFDNEKFTGLTPKEKKAILQSADIFVLKVLYDYQDKHTEDLKGKEMLESYLNNVDIVNGITKSTDDTQMPLPTIHHNVRGSILSKKHYNKALREINKDVDMETARIEGNEIAQIPTTWRERLTRPFKWITEKLQDRQSNKMIRNQQKQEKAQEKARRKEEKEIKDNRKKREKGVEQAIKAKERKRRKKPRESLGFDDVTIDYDSIRKNMEKNGYEVPKQEERSI